ncbi:response regulator [Paraglaciecola sp. L3A3]|uniref:response regulator n=1 Tax=Paraglaciecola sp. L3A3 TaxID=2686358 RepID=UPI00131A73F6|nr:response regulator [Paraglaciecola sp. L3A3]
MANTLAISNSPKIKYDVSIYQTELNLSPPNQAKSIEPWLSQFNSTDKIKLTGGKYWYHLKIPAQAHTAEWVLDINNTIIEYVDYYWFKDTQFVQQKSGYYQANDYPFQYGQKITLEAAVPYQVLIRVQSRYFASQPKIELITKQLYQKNNLFDSVLITSLLGALLALGLYNLFVFAGSNDKSHLFYALYLFTYFLGWAFVFQVPNYLFDFHFIELIYIPFFVLPLVGGYFCITFLHLDSHFPTLAKILKINGLVSFSLFPLSIFMVSYANSIATITIGIWIITAIVAGIKCWLNNFRPAGYFLMAFISLLIPASFILPANIGLLPDLLENSELVTLIGGTIDAIFLAFALADKLAITNQKNIELNNSLEQTVNIQTRKLRLANQQLEQTNTELIEASEAKGQFLATMSHEIRTPLTSIIGYADGILLGDIAKTEQDRVTRIISENGNHLLSIITDILDLTKIEANKLDYESIPTPLFAVLAQIESIVGKRARDKGLNFYLEYQYPLPAQIITDPTRLKQILFNLTNNALKFTEQGFIGLSVSVNNENLQIKIKDSGEGISPQQQQKLFEPFAQADSSINRRFGGTGLGLSISQRLARGLNGNISIDSKPKQGSCFTLDMKLLLPEHSSWIHNINEIPQPIPVKSVKQTALPNFSDHKILLADDHPTNRELIALLLKRMKISVFEVADGKQALDTLLYQSFDLILLDIHMPKMTGTEVLKQIRLAGNYTPVIALTANNMKHEVEDYLRLGFSDYLAKPISRQHFVDILEKYLTKHGDIDNPIFNDDMLSLIQDYQADLIEQIDQVQVALTHRDLRLISDIAHKIKGSAASFGYDLIGERFADIEHYALQDDEIAVTYELPKIIELARLCTDLPGINIPQAIINHHNSIETFINSIALFTKQSETLLTELKAAIENNQVNNAMLYFYKLLLPINDFALEQSISALGLLEELLKEGDWQHNKCLNLVQQVEQNILLLRKKLNSGLQL